MFRRAFHLFAFLLSVGALLYGRVAVAATDEPSSVAAPAVPTESKSPHIALLLPTGSQAFARAAEAVRSGFLDASKKQSTRIPPVRLYAIGDDAHNVIPSYRQALAAGAQLVVGPLTRNAVTVLAASTQLIAVPTLLLNMPERVASTASLLYILSLHVEDEARQVAQLALSEGRRKAFTVNEQTPLARRMREAFVQEFERGGGHHIAEYAYTTDAAELERMRQASRLGVADMVFLALDATRLRNVRTFISPITGYGTSQLNPGTGIAAYSGDIADVRFLDMPWMVQPDHPAVMVYARGGVRESDDFERLYALGIDAFRAAEILLNGKREIEIDGVTGRLKLGPDGRFRRGLLITLIDSGRLTILGETPP
jgi:outer membrane PBP1 activator LpoA protein